MKLENNIVMDFNYFYHTYASWIEQHFDIFQVLDAILFVIFSLCVLYLFMFTFFAKIKRKNEYPFTKVQAHFMVIIPVYGDDKLVFNSIDSALDQKYDKDKILIVVVLNNCSGQFIAEIHNKGVVVLNKSEEWEANLYSRDYYEALNYCKTNSIKVDVVSIIHCGDTLGQDNLIKINNAYYCGCDAIQIRRYFKDATNIHTILESVGEEINNSIFRVGHTALSLSSAVMSSGLSLSYEIFCKVIDEINDPYPEKQIETALLKRNIYIEYLSYAYMCRLNRVTSSAYYKHKKMGKLVHGNNLIKTVLSLPKYFFERKFDYCNKIIQWMIPSRITLTVMMLLMMLLVFMANITLGIKWFVLILILSMLYFVSIPSYLVSRKLVLALFVAPFFLIVTLFKMTFSRRR